MKKSITTILFLSLLWSCGVPGHTKDLLNVSFRNTLRDFYGEQGIFMTNVTSEVVLMDYYKGDEYPYKSKEEGYKGTIKCEFNDGNTKIWVWCEVGFNKYWQVEKLPDIYGTDKWDIRISDIQVSGISDYKDAIKSPYILAKFCSLDDSRKAINTVRKSQVKEPLE